MYVTGLRPCLRAMYSGISSMGPGRYKETMAIMSSNADGFNSFKYLFMPPDSNWKTPVCRRAPTAQKFFYHPRQDFLYLLFHRENLLYDLQCLQLWKGFLNQENPFLKVLSPQSRASRIE